MGSEMCIRDSAIVAEPGTNPQTYKAIQGTYTSPTFTPGDGSADVPGISQANVDKIFGASTGVTVSGEYYPPQHPTLNDISVHVQSDGYDVIFAVAPINAVSITVAGGTAQSIAAHQFAEDTDSNSPTQGDYVYSVSGLTTLSDGDAVAVLYNLSLIHI